MKFLREERNLFWTVCGLLVYGCLILLAVDCFSQEPTPATVEVPTAKSIEAIRDQSVTAHQHAVDALAAVANQPLDVTTGLSPGSDITTQLQHALDTLSTHKRPLYIPAGEWNISKTIRTPFKSGLTLLGAGRGSDAVERWIGSRTLLRWTGEPGGDMFAIQTSAGTIGDFTLIGDSKTTGIVITKPANGLGTGKILFRPIRAYGLDTAIQCGESLGMGNCDQLRFEWLEAEGCERAYRGLNRMGMGITFEQLHLTNTSIGIEMEAGGDLWVQNSLTAAGKCTLLKINSGDGVDKNNGRFRLSNTKVDAQAKDGFCLVDCAEPYPIAILADGGMHSNGDLFQGTFARLAGGNHLVLDSWTSSFRNITGSKDAKYGRPTVMITNSRLWGKPEEMFVGEVSGRIRDCVDAPVKKDTQFVEFEREGK